MTDKACFRREVRARVGAMTPAERGVADAQICAWLATHRPLRRGQLFAAYVALPDEVDVAAWWRAAAAEVPIALPRVTADGLVWHAVTANEVLVRGAWGVQEPSVEAPVVAITAIDGFVVPGRAFDASGRRLGRGGGSSDRALALARPEAWTVGVGYACQHQQALPHDPWDRSVGLLLDERGARAPQRD